MESYSRYKPALVRKAERMLRSKALAEDVVQGLFVDALEQRLGSHDLPYLYRAVSNRCLNVLRDDKRRAEIMRGERRRSFCTREADAVLALDALVKLTSLLAPEVVEAVGYAYLDDMTQEEIAAVMGLSRKTIGKYLDEAQATLKRMGV